MNALLSALFLIACQGSTPAPADAPPVGACVGLGSRTDEVIGWEDWTTEWVDAAGNPVLLRSWKDKWRTQMSARAAYDYDANGFLVSEREDWDGDDLDDARVTWQRGEDGEALEKHRTGQGATGAWETEYQVVYAYEDGLLSGWEALDERGGTTSSVRYFYEDRRPVRKESTTDGYVEVMTWTYTAPAPSLDSIEEAGPLDGEPEYTYERRHDDRDRLVWAEATYPRTGWHSVETFSWDEDRLLLSVNDIDTGLAVEQWAYDERGLPTMKRFERDDGYDGIIERALLSNWTWTCP